MPATMGLCGISEKFSLKTSPLGQWRQRLGFWSLLPLVALQGLWVRHRALRFAEAGGPATGRVGSGPRLRLLAIGDSIVAGVGARTFDEALVGRFAAALAVRTSHAVEWHAIGKTGARTAWVRRELLPKLPADPFDLIAVSVGVNDVTGLRRSRQWLAEVGLLLDGLRSHSPQAAILVAGLPPLHGFPLLPWPLRQVFGMRARTFDRFLEQLSASRERCFYIATDFDPTPDKFSADGYHPSTDSYRVWGKGLADRVVDQRIL